MAKTPCVPDVLPLQGLEWPELVQGLGEANRALARYDGLLRSLPNPAVLLSPIVVNEAVLSSRIEGTQATLDEVLEHDAGMDTPPRRRADIGEINNYRTAVQLAEATLSQRPFSLSLIKQLHQRLMQGVRGRDKAPVSSGTTRTGLANRGKQSRRPVSCLPTP